LLGDFNVAALDLPGHGTKARQRCVATIPAMAAAVAAEIPGPALVLGHSLGGVVATAIAERRPDLVTHLVVVDSPPDVASRIAATGHERALRRPVLGPLLWRTMSRRTVRNGLRTAFAPGFDFPDSSSSHMGHVRRRDVVFGQQEQRIDPASVAGWASTGAQVVRIAEAGHTPMWETPEPVAEAPRVFAGKTA
jgi:pimeloyl-ACP methyl ester carboxylesterase